MFGSAPILEVEVKNDVTTDFLMSCKRSSYTPSYKMEISRWVKIPGKRVRYARKEFNVMHQNDYPHYEN